MSTDMLYAPVSLYAWSEQFCFSWDSSNIEETYESEMSVSTYSGEPKEVEGWVGRDTKDESQDTFTLVGIEFNCIALKLLEEFEGKK